ncbi:MAG: HAD hydrolase-like protein [Clostridia bacterium]|jgi:2-haloacid dehalogenase|nr:HAD hydrolase-like protein [Clostridia bacterium]MDD4408629.1 HAD hydrolase-like protein [Clostridia bacterium]
MKKYKYLLFDLDDTLIDNFHNVKYAFSETLNHLGLKYSDAEFQKWLNHEKVFWTKRESQELKLFPPSEYKSSPELMIKWVRSQRFVRYFNLSLEKSLELNELYINSLQEVVYPIDGAYETLKYLSDKYQIIVSTNGPIVPVESKLTKINCWQFVDNVFAAEMFGVMKPNVKFFNEIKNRINEQNNSKFLVIGDSLINDIVGAFNADMDSCWLNSKKQPCIVSGNIKPTYEIYKLNELIKIL